MTFHRGARYVFILVIFVMCAPLSAYAQSHNCYKNAISDYICPQNSDIAPPGSAANSSTIGGASIFGSGGAIFSDLLGGGSSNSGALGSILSSFGSLYDTLPPALQNVFLSQLSSLDFSNLDVGDLTSVLGLFNQLQSGFEGLSGISCGGSGTLNSDYLVYAQNLYAQKSTQFDLKEMLGSAAINAASNVVSNGFDLSSIMGGLKGDVTSSICTPAPGSDTGGGATVAGGTGTATQEAAQAPDPAGTVQAPSSVTDGPGGWTLAKSQQAISISRVDNAGSGYCAKGVANIMLQMGYPVTRGNAHDWDQSLPSNGWTFLSGVAPGEAPPGALLVFDSDIHAGKPVGTTGGAKYGHVEIVTTTTDGKRQYVSDKPRNNWGGTVPDNYVGAWVKT